MTEMYQLCAALGLILSAGTGMPITRLEQCIY